MTNDWRMLGNIIRGIRPTHLIKNVLILPGVALGLKIGEGGFENSNVFSIGIDIFLVFTACSLIAMWNYKINDFCDRESDCWHPEKSARLVGERGSAIGLCILFVNGIVLVAGAFALVKYRGTWDEGFFDVRPIRL